MQGRRGAGCPRCRAGTGWNEDPAATGRGPHPLTLGVGDAGHGVTRVVGCGALLQPDPGNADAKARAGWREARDRYAAYFSSARLRQLARRHRGDRHGDLFEAAQLVFDALGTEGGVRELAPPAIGGIFEFRRDDGRALPLDEPLVGARLSNEALFGAVRALSLVKLRDGGAWRRVDFGHLGAEELGSVYESLLELIPITTTSNRHTPWRRCPATSARRPAPPTRQPRWSNACWTPPSTPCSTKHSRAGIRFPGWQGTEGQASQTERGRPRPPR